MWVARAPGDWYPPSRFGSPFPRRPLDADPLLQAASFTLTSALTSDVAARGRSRWTVSSGTLQAGRSRPGSSRRRTPFPSRDCGPVKPAGGLSDSSRWLSASDTTGIWARVEKAGGLSDSSRWLSAAERSEASDTTGIRASRSHPGRGAGRGEQTLNPSTWDHRRSQPGRAIRPTPPGRNGPGGAPLDARCRL